MNKKALLEELKYIYQDKILDTELAITNLNRVIDRNRDKPKEIDGLPNRVRELQRERNLLEKRTEFIDEWIGELK